MDRRVPFCDLSRSNRAIEADITQAMRRVVDSGWFLRGREVEAFEREWAEYCGQAHCVTCNSGTDSLTLATMALGLREARVPANTLPLTALGIERGGAHVIAEEIDAGGRLAEVAPTSVPVLLYGRLPSIAEQKAVLFDAAHAHGWKPPVHALACWSFYPTKSLGAFGDGGAVTTNDADLARTMRSLAGADDRLRDARQLTSRMDELQAAVLRVKLRHLDDWLAERRDIAQRYAAALPRGIAVSGADAGDLFHLFVVRTPRRDRLKAALRDAGVETKVHFPTPLHLLNAPWGRQSGRLPRAEAWCDSVLSLPCYPGLTGSEIARAAEVVGDHVAAAAA